MAGAPQAARLASLVKERHLPLLVTVNFDPPRAAAFFGGQDDEQEKRDIEEAETESGRAPQGGGELRPRLGPRAQLPAGIQKAIEKGLPRDVALAAVTLRAAEVLGVADRTGSLEAGKIANVVAWSGEPLTQGRQGEDGVRRRLPLRARGQARARRRTPRSRRRRRRPSHSLPPLAATPSLPLPPASDAPLALVGGTLLTVGPQGTIENGTIVIRGGKIAAVGKDVACPRAPGW